MRNGLALGLLLVSFQFAFGQTPAASPSATAVPAPPSFWRCDLPGGNYEVNVHAIVSVSTHEYVVDGVARVREVNVDTQGNMAVRFYFIDQNVPKAPLGVGQSAIDRVSDLAKEATQRVGADDVWKRVVKSYPATTHAHTIEFRLGSDDEMNQILTSVRRSFETGRGGSIKLGTD
ncbi:MAG: hypothetical protein M3R43_03935 [Acidobacteriota bacterium]|nr:hypothetical protein [Acidobacteriota bacterium]